MSRPPFSGDRDARIAEAAATAAMIFASKEGDPSESLEPVAARSVTARFLAVGDAHVTIADADGEPGERFLVTCEACGPLTRRGYFGSVVLHFGREDAERAAIEHAETCRRIPERLWPKDGA